MDGLCLITSNSLQQNWPYNERKSIIQQFCTWNEILIIERLLSYSNALQDIILCTPTLHEKNTRARCSHTTNRATQALFLHIDNYSLMFVYEPKIGRHQGVGTNRIESS